MSKRDPEFIAGYVLGSMLSDSPVLFVLALFQIVHLGRLLTHDLCTFILLAVFIRWAVYEFLLPE